jgi:hypothetical protein
MKTIKKVLFKRFLEEREECSYLSDIESRYLYDNPALHFAHCYMDKIKGFLFTMAVIAGALLLFIGFTSYTKTGISI